MNIYLNRKNKEEEKSSGGNGTTVMAPKNKLNNFDTT